MKTIFPMKIITIFLLLLASLTKAQTKIKTVTKTPVSKTKTTTATVSNNVQQSVDRGKEVYHKYCLACHQADGGGVTNLNPPFVQEWAGGDKSRIIRMILKGSKGTVEIDGDKFSNPMAAQPYLTDQQLADVLTFVRNNFGVKASPVTAAEVKAVRAKTLGH